MALRTQSGNLVGRTNVAAGASQNIVSPNSERSGLQVSADGAGATGGLTYLKLYSGKDGVDGSAGAVASAADYDIVLGANGSWPGTIGGVVWTGGVTGFQAGAPTGRIVAQDT